ncbi:hypothetical protein BDV41DRAFT_570309 [Aspergillus transmontanensis]|uniref:Uncharacterized protein n=1 Tax=Aspergillus transmontanensis TaxID=1034304 RepID=A0A5N6WK37_9EURO|nr:hypothetical protein BDV41DRAFT_570309 [Aspergillus transmontanensis]
MSLGDSNSLSLDMTLRTTIGAWVDLFNSYMAWGKALRDIVAQWVQQIPLGLVVKECDHPLRNKGIASRLVEQYTTTPAPHVVDVVEGKVCLIVTRLHGQLLADVWPLMSYAAQNQFDDGLNACIAHLRKIPNNTPYKFRHPIASPYLDHRIPDGSAGPFNSESEFNAHLTSHLSGILATIFPGRSIRLDHRSYSTYSDMHPLSLPVYRGRLSGTVDWECAGYMPEYCEFTKAMYGTAEGIHLSMFSTEPLGVSMKMNSK